MRVVIQKVTYASVDIEKQTVASINKGLLVLVEIVILMRILRGYRRR